MMYATDDDCYADQASEIVAWELKAGGYIGNCCLAEDNPMDSAILIPVWAYDDDAADMERERCVWCGRKIVNREARR